MSTYDFIVVGTGSAGSAVATRLSEISDVNVLALEAGGEPYPENVTNPALWYTLFGTPVDWGYLSVPQKALGGRPTYEPRGKMPGGSSNLYIMMHIRGHRSDYDNWAYNGCPGWSYDECLSFFQKLEDQEDDTNPTGGKGGPIHLSNAGQHDPNPTSQAFLDACAELGFPSTDDFNGPNMEGAGWHHINVKDGKRFSTREGYLEPNAYRENLTLSTHSQATRLILENGRCVGVEYVKDGERREARASKEVIVCAGAIESPHLLLCSGIGATQNMRPYGIQTRAELPGVGENFHNHVLTGVIREGKQQVPTGKQNLSEVALFCKSDPKWPAPDLQIAFVHVPFDIIVGQTHPNAISILPGVVRPLSRGYVRLSSADPLVKPRVNPNYLAAKADRDRLVQGVKLAREIFATRAFSDWAGEELLPGPEFGNSDEDLNRFVTGKADSYHHQAGSCRMGLDELAVVDPELRVHGVEGLRVADASVMPAVPSGNCHAGIVMIAERCADFLKTTHGLHRAAVRDRHGGEPVSLEGKKIAVLMEADYYEPEIWYYARRFPEEGAEVHFLTRLWGQERLTFAGHEWKVPFEVDRSFEDMDDATLRSYAAVIVPSGMVSDRLRYTEDVNELPPATEFIRRAFHEPSVLKGIICHGMWLVAPVPELVRGRPVVVHNNLHGDARNMGAIYTDEDVVVDRDLVTARTGGHCHLFAKKIIELLDDGRR